MRIINDIHIGAVRTGGTTPQSSLALRNWILQEFEVLVSSTISRDLCILGDLFDSHTVSSVDLSATFRILNQWCKDNPDYNLLLVRGNHDINSDSSKISSFDALGNIMQAVHSNVMVVNEPILHKQDTYIIPHLANQTLLDEALKQVPDVRYLLVHANYDNHFAKESDHSLNISKEQAEAVPAEYIIFAHEHNSRIELAGKVVIPGNQIPTSISDCLKKSKNYTTLYNGQAPELHSVWYSDYYEEVDWKEATPSNAKFIRIVGEATAEQAPDVANAVAKYRKTSQAFVVGNAVKMTSQTKEILPSLESVQGFDVMKTLKELLTESELKIIEDIL